MYLKLELVKPRAESGPLVKITRAYSSSLDELLCYAVEMYEQVIQVT